MRIFLSILISMSLTACAGFQSRLMGGAGIGAGPNEWYDIHCRRETRRAVLADPFFGEQTGSTRDTTTHAGDGNQPGRSEIDGRSLERCHMIEMMRAHAAMREHLVQRQFSISPDDTDTWVATNQGRYAQNTVILTDALCAQFFDNLQSARLASAVSRNSYNIAFETLSTLMGLYETGTQALTVASTLDLAVSDIHQQFETFVYLTPDPAGLYRTIRAQQQAYLQERGNLANPPDVLTAMAWSRDYVRSCSPVGIQNTISESLARREVDAYTDQRNPSVEEIVADFVDHFNGALSGGALTAAAINGDAALLLYWYFVDAQTDLERNEALRELRTLNEVLATQIASVTIGSDAFSEASEIWGRYDDAVSGVDLLLRARKDRIRQSERQVWVAVANQISRDVVSDRQIEIAECRETVQSRLTREIAAWSDRRSDGETREVLEAIATSVLASETGPCAPDEPTEESPT